MPQYMERVHMDPTCPAVQLPSEVERREKDKGNLDPRLPMSRLRKIIADSCTGNRLETAQIYV